MSFYLLFDTYSIQYKSKQLALFHAIREAIHTGKLLAHEQLPSTRKLANQLELSRGTVSNVFDMLVAQGYLYSLAGSGTFVSEHYNAVHFNISNTQSIPFSQWGNRLVNTIVRTASTRYTTIQSPNNPDDTPFDSTIDFGITKVNLSQFPLQEWNKILFKHTRQQYDNETSDTYATDGHPQLKRSIASQLYKHRGINIDAEQIVIVNGSQQALTLLAQLLVDKDDHVAFENPHYIGFREPIQVLGGKIDVFPVDEEGMFFQPKHKCYKFIYTTANRHFPTGSVMSMTRRKQLLQWANTHNTFIIEDDYDSEFNYTSRAVEPLKALDTQDNVIYVGTFSRTMMQYIRIGYVILPKRLVEPFKLAKSLFERHPTSIIEQRALSTFIDSGQFDRHLRRVRRLYRQRANLIYNLMQHKLSRIVEVKPIKAGLHLYALWIGPPHLFHSFLERAKTYRITLINSEPMYMGDIKPSLCLGFAHLTSEEIEEGIERLLLAWESLDEAQSIS